MNTEETDSVFRALSFKELLELRKLYHLYRTDTNTATHKFHESRINSAIHHHNPQEP